MVGAVSNRTYNYYTQSDTGTLCKVLNSELDDPDNVAYKNSSNYSVSDLDQNIKFKDMGVFRGYQIEWINALTGEVIDTTEKISDSFGHLKLEFPDTLTGNATCPIMFFKLYRIDATFLAPIIPDENQTSLPANFVKDESTYPIEQTDWSISTKNDLNLTISPNPTDGIINVSITGRYDESYTWQLLDVNARVINTGNATLPNFNLDISVYTSGVYYLKVYSPTNQVQSKIVKL